ncbi:MAG: glycosyltransferase family 2 protein [Oscillospiraceae bacterium]|nr:glycosyltransferase family 2 protein [Oscillospiraceae bacterium]
MNAKKKPMPTWANRNMLFNLVYKTFRMLRDEGFHQTLFAIRYVTLRRWQMRSIRKNMKMTSKKREIQQNTVFKIMPKIGVIVPLYNTPTAFLEDLVNSLKNQTYSNWQLCLADGSDNGNTYIESYCSSLAKNDTRFIYQKLDKNYGIAGNRTKAAELSDGEYICFLDHDDMLAERALFEVVKAINESHADFLYSDEIIYMGKRNMVSSLHLKPDYSPDYLRCCNYICHLTVIKQTLVEKIGLYNANYDGSEDYDFVLRATEAAETIYHIDEPIYYWRVHEQSVASDISAKPYAWDSAKRAVEAHLERVGLKGKVEYSASVPMLHVNYEIEGTPLVSIIIPSSDHREDLEKCINSILNKSTYENYEIIIIENNSKEEVTFEYYRELQHIENIQIVYWDHEFNFSAINNYGVACAKGQHYLFLNNDVEVITSDWIEQMLMFTQREDVGVAGVKLLYEDDTVQHGGIAVGVAGSAANLCQLFPRAYEGYMSRLAIVSNMSAVTAACMMVKKAAFEAVGGFDEILAVSFNDVDLCLRIREVGYLVVFNPVAELYHYESRSRGYDTKGDKRVRMEREKAILVERWQKYFTEKGDPYYNKNFGKQSVSYDSMI